MEEESHIVLLLFEEAKKYSHPQCHYEKMKKQIQKELLMQPLGCHCQWAGMFLFVLFDKISLYV